MKKRFIILFNVFIIAAMLVFIGFYSGFENRESFQRQIDHFENTAVTLEQVTENYLEGEQRICDVWARYINSRPMTMEEAADFIRSSHVLANTSVHLISLDTLTGISTRPKLGTTDDYTVSYNRLDLLENTDWINEIGESINISRAYTNPMNRSEERRVGKEC